MEKKFLESTLEQIIYSHREIIHEYGLPKMYKNTLRQFRLPSGKIIDLFSFDIKDNIFNCSIFELKKENVDESTLVQAYNYVFELSALFNNQFFGWNPRIILVGDIVKPMPILNDVLFPVELYSYSYTIDGIKFKKIESPSTDFCGDEDFSNMMCAINKGMISCSPSCYKELEQFKTHSKMGDVIFFVIKIANILNKTYDEAYEYVKEKVAETDEEIVYIEGLGLKVKR